jgi:hypothetical protein
MTKLVYDSITGRKATIESGITYKNPWRRGGDLIGFKGNILAEGISGKFRLRDDSIVMRTRSNFVGRANGKRANGILRAKVVLDGTRVGKKNKFRDFKVDTITGNYRLVDKNEKRGTTRSKISAEFAETTSFVKDFMQSSAWEKALFSDADPYRSKTTGFFSFNNSEWLLAQSTGFGFELGTF